MQLLGAEAPEGLLPPPEDQLHAHLVSGFQELLGEHLPHLSVVLAHLERNAHALRLDFPLLLAALPFAFILLVLVPAVVEEAADRRDGRRVHLNEIEAGHACLPERLEDGDDPDLLPVGANKTHLRRADALVHAEPIAAGRYRAEPPTLRNGWNDSRLNLRQRVATAAAACQWRHGNPLLTLGRRRYTCGMPKVAVALVGGLVALVVLVLVAFAMRSRPAGPEAPVQETATAPLAEAPAPVGGGAASPGVPSVSRFTFGIPKKAAHYENSTPAHGAVLAAPPIAVVIDVNFDLAANSSISVTSGGKEYGTGATTVDANKLALRRAVDQGAPDGLYAVAYRACWPDGSCHDGSFQFAIDRSQGASATDLRDQANVTIALRDIAFQPAAVRVRRGTTVTWRNDDAVAHYVNTDAHPSHTYYPAQNSKVLNPGDTYTLAFASPGAYPYHCSAHADVMPGTILVE